MASPGGWCGHAGSCVRIGLTVLITATLVPGVGGAQEPDNHLYDRYQLSAAATVLLLGATVRFDAEGGGSGTEFEPSDALGLSRQTVEPRAGFRWRPGRRHELELSYVLARRSAEQTIIDTIRFRDTAFAAGARVASTMRTDQAMLEYRYAFTARERTQIGIGVGLGALLARLELDALAGATRGGADTSRVDYIAERSVTVPTGSLGLYARFRSGDRWYFSGDGRGLYLKIENFKIYVVEAGLSARYFFASSLGGEAGYTLSYYRVDVTRVAPGERRFLGIDFTGKINYTVNGFRAGLVYAF